MVDLDQWFPKIQGGSEKKKKKKSGQPEGGNDTSENARARTHTVNLVFTLQDILFI